MLPDMVQKRIEETGNNVSIDYILKSINIFPNHKEIHSMAMHNLSHFTSDLTELQKLSCHNIKDNIELIIQVIDNFPSEDSL
jgi:hypothetical protein